VPNPSPFVAHALSRLCTPCKLTHCCPCTPTSPPAPSPCHPCPGSGKTHTMSGVEDVISDDLYVGDARDGIVSRAAQYLFHQVRGGGAGGLGEVLVGWVSGWVGRYVGGWVGGWVLVGRLQGHSTEEAFDSQLACGAYPTPPDHPPALTQTTVGGTLSHLLPATPSTTCHPHTPQVNAHTSTPLTPSCPYLCRHPPHTPGQHPQGRQVRHQGLLRGDLQRAGV
jgi:hypothetical protein